MVLELVLLVGLGSVPLWPLVPVPALRLGLATGSDLGSRVGLLAAIRRLLRLGAVATDGSVPGGSGVDFPWPTGGPHFWFRLKCDRVYLCGLRPFYGPTSGRAPGTAPRGGHDFQPNDGQ